MIGEDGDVEEKMADVDEDDKTKDEKSLPLRITPSPSIVKKAKR